MEDLKIEYAYDLRDLNDKQIEILSYWFEERKVPSQSRGIDTDWIKEFREDHFFHHHNPEDEFEYLWGFDIEEDLNNKKIVNALELFDVKPIEYNLKKIGFNFFGQENEPTISLTNDLELVVNLDKKYVSLNDSIGSNIIIYNHLDIERISLIVEALK